MFSDDASPRGPHNSAAEGEPLRLLLAAPEPNHFLTATTPPALPSPRPAGSPAPEGADSNIATAPIHKISRGALSSFDNRSRRSSDADSSKVIASGLEVQTFLNRPTLSSTSPVRITGVATIILPPHQTNASLAPISSSTLCSTASSLPKLSHLLSSATSELSASSHLPAKQPSGVGSNHVENSNPKPSLKQISSSRTTVIDLNLFNTGPTDLNNNNIATNKNSIDSPHIVTSTSSSYKDNSSSVNNCNRNTSIDNINTHVTHSTCIDREEFDKFTSGPLNSLEDFFNTQLPFDFEKEIQRSNAHLGLHSVHTGDDVFSDTNATTNKYKACKGINRNDILPVVKSDPDSIVPSHLPTTVLPPFSSVFNEPSPLSYPSSISHYSSHYHYAKSDNEDDVMTTMPSLPTPDTIMNVNPVFGLNRTDSGFYTSSMHSSRTNSSSSCSSSSSARSTSSMDLDYEEAWASDMAEERNYTDLTSVRPDCHGQEFLTNIMNEDEEGSLHILLSDSNAIKPEPLEDYPGFSMTDFINNLEASELDSDGYSSSTDNETPHYTQLEEPSSFSFFSTSSIMGGFPPLPVTPSDQAKVPIASAVPNNLGQPSPENDQSHTERWIIARENLPDFRKLQDPSAEEEKKPTPSRRRLVPSSPKEKKKAARESPTLSEKSPSDRKKPGRKKGQVSNVLHLWEFMRDLLKDPSRRGDIIEWISEKDGVFRVVNSAEVARLWGEKKKNKKEMTYEKMSRSLRYSRLEGYFSDLPKDKNYPKKLCFKFGPKSKDWF